MNEDDGLERHHGKTEWEWKRFEEDIEYDIWYGEPDILNLGWGLILIIVLGLTPSFLSYYWSEIEEFLVFIMEIGNGS